MAQVKFIGKGERDVPRPGRPNTEAFTVKHGQVVEVDDAHAKSLTQQSDVWEAVKDAPKTDAKQKDKE
jgi:hypothetical protein